VAHFGPDQDTAETHNHVVRSHPAGFV